MKHRGYYWVKLYGGWQPAWFSGRYWYLTDSVIPRVDTDFSAIGEKLIPPED